MDDTVAQPRLTTLLPLVPEQEPSPEVCELAGSQSNPKSKPPKLGDR